jgi:hypothetical protein
MKKAILFVAVSAFVGFTALSVSADNTIPGAYDQAGNGAGIGVNQTIMQMGAQDRALTNAVNLSSRAGSARSDAGGVNRNYQFGSSQTEQSWKAARTIEEAQVFGLVPGDCRGDNSDGAYRKQMNQNRKGYMAENLVSQADCEIDHATMNQNLK